MKGSCLCGAVEYEIDQLDVGMGHWKNMPQGPCSRIRFNRRRDARSFTLDQRRRETHDLQNLAGKAFLFLLRV